MARADQRLVDGIRAALADAADPAKADSMQAYMKSAMPFHGIQKAERVRALRPVLRTYPPTDRDAWVATVLAIWDGAAFREERYAAIDLARHSPYAAWASDMRSLELYDHLIVTGAWWDYVDDVAIRLVGAVLRSPDHRDAGCPGLGARPRPLAPPGRSDLPGRRAP